MTSSDPDEAKPGASEDARAEVTHGASALSPTELLAGGWERRFIYDEPRLSEAVETYRELGFEVLLVPVAADDAECTECMLQEPERFRVIYTRKRDSGASGAGAWEEDT